LKLLLRVQVLVVKPLSVLYNQLGLKLLPFGT
jgi:hypothetical protein